MKINQEQLELINKYFNDEMKEQLLEQLEYEIIKENMFELSDNVEKYLNDNEKCCNIKRSYILLFGDFKYTYLGKRVSIDIESPNSLVIKVNDSYTYKTEFAREVLNIIPKIHQAIEDGIII